MSSRRRGGTGNRFIRWMGPVAFVMLMVAGLTAIVSLRTDGIRLLSVQSGSMAPLFSKGDAVLVRRVNPLDIKPGDIISHVNEDGLVVTHRVVAVDPRAGTVITKGDNNQLPDTATDMAAVSGKVAYIIPGGGRLIDWAHSWEGLVSLVYVPAGLVLVHEYRGLYRHYKTPSYRLRSWSGR